MNLPPPPLHSDLSLSSASRKGGSYGAWRGAAESLIKPLAVTADHRGSVYGLGNRFNHNHVTVETRLWWKGDWQLHWHHITAYQESLLRLGSHSLPLVNRQPLVTEVQKDHARAYNGEQGVAIQTLLGFNTVGQHDSNPEKRTHILTPHSVVLTAETAWLNGAHDLIVLSWTGSTLNESRRWSVITSEKGRLDLRHPELGDWIVEDADLPMLSTGKV